jgi:hypothetical protein
MIIFNDAFIALEQYLPSFRKTVVISQSSDSIKTTGIEIPCAKTFFESLSYFDDRSEITIIADLEIVTECLELYQDQIESITIVKLPIVKKPTVENPVFEIPKYLLLNFFPLLKGENTIVYRHDLFMP